MSQIDAIFHFASVAAARADPIVQQYMSRGDDGQLQFRGDLTVANVRVWRPSADVAGTDSDGNPTVTHTYLTGFFVFVSADHVVPALRDHPALQVAVDRDKMNARQAGMVLKNNVTAPILQDMRFEPILAGMDPPWGAWI